MTAPDNETDTAPRERRRRRTREAVTQQIREAAQQLFTERGYAAATTREIALRADVSETLLFRYFGDKAGLFDAVVTEPFQRLMDEFALRHSDPDAENYHRAAARDFTRHVYELFERNEGLFRVLLTGPFGTRGTPGPVLTGLDPFFAQAVQQVEQRYARAGIAPPFDLNLGARLGFGMIAASVLLRHPLFPGPPPDRDRMIDALEGIVELALFGPTLD